MAITLQIFALSFTEISNTTFYAASLIVMMKMRMIISLRSAWTLIKNVGKV